MKLKNKKISQKKLIEKSKSYYWRKKEKTYKKVIREAKKRRGKNRNEEFNLCYLILVY